MSKDPVFPRFFCISHWEIIMKQFIRLLLLSIVCVGSTLSVSAQNNVGIGTNSPNAAAILDLTATTQGLLLPRLNPASITSPLNGLVVFNSATNQFQVYTSGAWFNITTSATAGALTTGQGVTVNGSAIDWGAPNNSSAFFTSSRFLNMNGQDLTITGGVGSLISFQNTDGLSVSGISQLGGVTTASMSMSGASTFTSGTGMSTIQGPLAVTGATTFANGINGVNGNLSVLSRLYVTSNTYALGGLSVNSGANQYTLVGSRGSSGQYLQTNGAGTTSWQSLTPAGIGALTYGGTPTTTDQLIFETGAATLSSSANLTWNSINNILSATHVVVSGNMSATNATIGPAVSNYTLPTVRGSSGQYLQTNGAGTTSWQSLTPAGIGALTYGGTPTTTDQLIFETGAATLSSSANLTWNSSANILSATHVLVSGNMSATNATIGPAVSNYTLPTVRGSSGQYLQTNGAGTTSWQSFTPGASSSAFFGAVPAGSRQIVFEAGGTGTASLSSSANLTWNNTNNVLTTPNVVVTNTLAATAATIPTMNGTVTIGNGLTVSAGGASISGSTIIDGSLGGITGLTVASGGAQITAGGLTVVAGTTSTPNLAVGAGGPTISGIYRSTSLAFAFPANIAGWAQSLRTATLTNAALSGTVFVSPVNALPPGIVVAFARVSAINTIQIGLQSTTSGSVAVGTINFTVTVIQ